MRLAAAAVTLLLLTGTGHAQINMWGAGEKAADPEAEEKQRQIDKAYKDKIKSQPAQAPAANDPWGSVRASGTPSSQSKAQTGSKNR